jgi:hypothetical protein
MQRLIILSMFVFATLFLPAQNNDYSIGLRMGSYSGISARFNFESQTSLELILGGKDHGLTSTFLLQFNKPIDLYWSRGFSWYWGVGSHFGYMRAENYVNYFNIQSDESFDHFGTVPTAGIDGSIGLMYSFADLPIELVLDTKPLMEIINVRRFRMRIFETSLTLRYKFNHYL